jgi:hypothetical protein
LYGGHALRGQSTNAQGFEPIRGRWLYQRVKDDRGGGGDKGGSGDCERGSKGLRELKLLQSGSEQSLKFFYDIVVSGKLMPENIILSDKVWGKLFFGSGDRSSRRSGGHRGG